MNIRPLHDQVLIRVIEEEDVSSGGIVLPESAKEKPVQGEVIAIGNGKVLANGKIKPLDIKVKDTVLFGKFSGSSLKIEGNEFLVMREDDLIAVEEG